MAAERFQSAGELLIELACMDEKSATTKDGLDLNYFKNLNIKRLENLLHMKLTQRSEKFSERGISEAARQIINCKKSLTLTFGKSLVVVDNGKINIKNKQNEINHNNDNLGR